MRKVIYAFVFLACCAAGLQAQTPVKGLTVTGAYDTMKTVELTPRFVSRTGELFKRPMMTINGQVLQATIEVTASDIATCSVTAVNVTATATAAHSGDYVLPIVERGVCYGISENPTLLSGTKIVDATLSGNGAGNFEIQLTGLEPATTYHARAYAVCVDDTVYGSDISFTTLAKTYCTVANARTNSSVYTGSATTPGTGGLETLYGGTTNRIDSVKDQNGNAYPVVQLGSQCWMAENLRATSYDVSLTGVPSLYYNDNSATNDAYYGAPGGDLANVPTYGYLYSWYAVMGGASASSAVPSEVQGICPKDWHVPSYEELKQMPVSLGMTQSVNNGNTQFSDAGKLAKGCMWNTEGVSQTPDNPMPGNLSSTERNLTGFGGIPAGSFESSVKHFNVYVNHWTTTQASASDQAYSFGIDYATDKSGLYPNAKSIGFSVRCVRDVPSMNMSSSKANPCAGEDVVYTAVFHYSVASDYDFIWKVNGVTQSSTSSSLTHSHAAIGSDTVVCVATNKSDNTLVLTDTIKVMVKGIATMEYTINRGNSDNFGTVTINTTTATSASWKLGSTEVGTWASEGNTDILPVGTYTVEISNNCGTSTISGIEILTSPVCSAIFINSTTNETAYTFNGTNYVQQVKDHENNSYNVVQIGNQCWLRENIRTTSSPSTGNTIVTGRFQTYKSKAASWYNNNAGANAKYGLLYNWYAAVDTFETSSPEVATSGGSGTWQTTLVLNAAGHRRGICPAGWHIPTEAELNTMGNFVKSKSLYQCNNVENYIAKSLCSTTDWSTNTNNNCYVGNDLSTNNATGFTALPTGFFSNSFYAKEVVTDYWTISQNNDQSAKHARMGNDRTTLNIEGGVKCDGRSVRCVRDVIPTLDLSTVTGNTTVPNGWMVTGTLGGNYQISIADGATVILNNATINSNSYPGITCLGDATIVLAGTNTLNANYSDQAGIQIGGTGTTLTIEGDGFLSATGGSGATGIGFGRVWETNVYGGNIVINNGTIIAKTNGWGTGIGVGVTGYGEAIMGDITINGGDVKAIGKDGGAGIGTGFIYPNAISQVGDITINGGRVEAIGGGRSVPGVDVFSGAAGIGTGENPYGVSSAHNIVGNITISSAVTSVTATKGTDDTVSIGASPGGICGTITIEDPSKVTQN